MECLSCHRENPEGQKFCGDCGRPLEGDEIREAADSSPDAAASGERRQVTVLFSDLSGYTAMTERLDPEEVREIMGQVFGEASQVIARYGGVIEKYIGDAVMAVFGMDQAHEDDAVRAVRAAREIQQFVEELSPRFRDRVGRDLSMHTGINTGLVITGSTGGAEGAMGVIGDAVNVASRLSGLAEAGQVLVGSDTAPLVERFFGLEALSATQVKGRQEAVKVFRVLEARERPAATRRLAGLRAGLVGREVEMALLNQSTQRLRDGKGSIIALRGEAGTGKSRLIDDFRESIRQSHQWLHGNCFDHAQGIPYFPLVDMLSHAWGIEEGDSPASLREKVEREVGGLLGADNEAVGYIGMLYALDHPEAGRVGADFRNKKMQESLLALFHAMAARGPTVFYFDDLHWADPSSVGLLRYVLTHFETPAITLCAYRPPFRLFPGEGKTPGFQELALETLSPTQVEDLTVALMEGARTPRELVSFIQQRAGGNPFYVEEVLNSLLETEALRRDNSAWKLAGRLEDFNVPATIQGVIASRLDRLEPLNKRLLQEASVIGLTFLYQVLGRVASQAEALPERLENLERTDMIHALSMEPDLEYMFKHPLTREVVYHSLLINERKAIHEKTGAVMESLLADRLPEFYETLAHHFLNGLSTGKAVRYLIDSGRKALDNLNLEESARYFQSAYELLAPKAEKSEEDWNLFFDLLEAWALNFYYFGTFPKLIDLLEKHEIEAETLRDIARRAMFFGWLGFAYWSWGRHSKAHPYLQRALGLAEESGNQRVIAHINTWAGWLYPDLGRFDEAMVFGERAVQIAREFLPTDHYLNFKPLCAMAVTALYRGDIGKIWDYANAAVAYSRQHGSLRGESLGLLMFSQAEFAAGNFEKARDFYDQAMGVAVDPFYAGIPAVFSVVLNAAVGNFNRALELLPVAENCIRDGAEMFLPFMKIFYGLRAFAEGRFSQGLRAFIECMEIYRSHGGVHPMGIHGLGKCYLMLLVGDKPPLGVMLKNFWFLLKTLPVAAKQAERYLTEALTVAEKVGAEGIEGQAHLDLGILYKARKKREKSLEHLKKAEEIFERTQADGFLAQTREALAELGTL